MVTNNYNIMVYGKMNEWYDSVAQRYWLIVAMGHHEGKHENVSECFPFVSGMF